ncbi:hypothetical protein GCM10027258_91120 [Amycolatopsis stemonae]
MKGKHRDAAAYELGVLDDPEEFETHLRDCARCQDLVAGFQPVTGALAQAARLGYLPGGGPTEGGPPSGTYPPPGDGAARRRKPCAFSGRRGPVTGALLLLALGVAVTVVCAARPAVARTWFASAASIVSPAQVVAGTGRDLRDLPWQAGFQ